MLVLVGVGGMGRVWAARRVVGLASNPLVAIKTGLGEVGGTPEFERLFMDEARIASLIEHPNVCAVHELARESGTLYLVMEWCDGATLRDVLDGLPDGRLDLEVAARMVAKICAGLHAAHELHDSDGTSLNVVHRDVSPQNVLVWAGGHVKIADFGVAKARGQLHRPTETGEVKGKLSYMAPEQVTSSHVDRRADVFGLGCLLYEATLGQRPYQGGDALATLYQLLERDTVPPHQIDAEYPQEFERIVMRALAKDPRSRYQSAEELGLALESWLASHKAIVTESRIAKIVDSAVGETLRTRRRFIAETIARFDEAKPAPESTPPLQSAGTDAPTVRPVPARVRSERGPTVGPRLRSRDRGLIAWLSVGAAALLFVVILLVLNRGRGVDVAVATTSSSPAASPPVASTAPPPVKVVTITVSAEPPSAIIRLDDEKEGSNPLVRRVPADGSRHVLVATAPGHNPLTRWVIFEEGQDVIPLVLKALPRPAATAAPPPPAGPTGRQPGQPLPRSTSRTEPKVRELDERNPFETAR